MTNEKAKKIERKTALALSVGLSLANAFVLSLTGTLASGYFTGGIWMACFGISLVGFLILTNVVPIKKFREKVYDKLKTSEETNKGKFANSVLLTLLFAPVLMILVSVMAGAYGINQADMIKSGADAQLQTLVRQCETKQAELDALLPAHESLQAEYADMQTDLEVKTAELAVLQEEFNLLEMTVTEEATGQTTTVTDVQDETIETVVTESVTESSVVKLKNDIIEMETAIAGIEANLKDTKALLDKQSAGIDALNLVISGLNAEIEKQTTVGIAAVKPNILLIILKTELIGNLVGIALNFLLYAPLLKLAVKIAKYKPKVI